MSKRNGPQGILSARNGREGAGRKPRAAQVCQQRQDPRRVCRLDHTIRGEHSLFVRGKYDGDNGRIGRDWCVSSNGRVGRDGCVSRVALEDSAAMERRYVHSIPAEVRSPARDSTSTVEEGKNGEDEEDGEHVARRKARWTGRWWSFSRRACEEDGGRDEGREGS